MYYLKHHNLRVTYTFQTKKTQFLVEDLAATLRRGIIGPVVLPGSGNQCVFFTNSAKQGHYCPGGVPLLETNVPFLQGDA